MNRIKTGVTGFDQIIGGGIPENCAMLLSGTCGAGKTIFSLQFISAFAEKEPGVYVTFEASPQQLHATAKMFGWDLEKLEKAGKIRILKFDPFKHDDLYDVMDSNIREVGARRVVIDTFSKLGLYINDRADLRNSITQAREMLSKNKCTSVILDEVPALQGTLSTYGVEEFVCDGVVNLKTFFSGGEFKRTVAVWKMRDTKHSKNMHPYEINEKGFVVYSRDIARF